MGKTRKHLHIQGRVQGVWFRDSTRTKALSLSVSGWVRNLPDGSVEVLVEGENDQVKRLVSWCKQGPPSADVSSLVERQEEWKGEFDTFSIVY